MLEENLKFKCSEIHQNEVFSGENLIVNTFTKVEENFGISEL